MLITTQCTLDPELDRVVAKRHGEVLVKDLVGCFLEQWSELVGGSWLQSGQLCEWS